ncbi:CatB-related O-acetyltransferase [Rahnella sp. PCH160]|uniref:CatB-related O-acetyltransferase n=1 Tax=Rahnella sp. PCH160 TaxID=3447928 RepID=UPI0039FDA784
MINFSNCTDLNPESLCDKYFKFSRLDGSYLHEPIKLNKDGSIYGYSHYNEASWTIIEGVIAFLNKSGDVSTLFDRISLEQNRLIMCGSFLIKPHLNITHKLEEISYDWEKRPRHKNLTKNLLKEQIKKLNWKIGDHTYGNPKILEAKYASLTIGKFCSIADDVIIILANHKVDLVTTYPFATLKKFWPSMKSLNLNDHYSNGDVTIGNDVWIGHSVKIMSGVTIGNGVVIAANSVVTKNIPDYGMVGGTPAKIIRYRFNEEVVNQLMLIEWWDWEDEKIDEALPYMMKDIQLFIEKYS